MEKIGGRNDKKINFCERCRKTFKHAKGVVYIKGNWLCFSCRAKLLGYHIQEILNNSFRRLNEIREMENERKTRKRKNKSRN